MLICREFNCAKTEDILEFNLNKSHWKPVIDEKQILTSMVAEPTDEEVKRSRDITIEMINQLETLRKNDPNATIKQLEANKMQEPLPHINLRYSNGEEYYSIFSRLIDRESLTDKTEKEKQMQKDVEVSWELSLKKKWIAKFAFPSSEEYGSNWFIGNEMKLSCYHSNGTNFSSRGHAVRFTPGIIIITHQMIRYY